MRIDGRSVIQVDEQRAQNVRNVFHLYGYQNHTLDMIVARLAREGVNYTDAQPQWPRSKVHTILRDRAYIGEVFYQGRWHPGAHKPIIDRATWERVQVLAGEKLYKSHELTYAGELVRCAHCGAPVTGESVLKKSSGKEYVYYRCTRYTAPGHPRVRLTEAQLDAQALALFARLKQPQAVCDWFARTLRAWAQAEQAGARTRSDDVQRQLSALRAQQDRLLNLRLLEEIDADTFARKGAEMRDRIASLTPILGPTASLRCHYR